MIESKSASQCVKMAHSTSNLVATADLEFGARASAKRASGDMKIRSSLCLRRLCYGLVFLAFAAAVVFTGYQPARQIGPSSTTVRQSRIPSYWQHETQLQITRVTHIEDVVTIDSGEVLVLLQTAATAEFPSKDRLECRFGDHSTFAYTAPLALHLLHQSRAAILCAPPPPDLAWDATSLLIEVDQAHEIGVAVASQLSLIQWNSSNLVVYESFATDDDVVVFVHGMNSSRGVDLSPDAELTRLGTFQCVFNDECETLVTSQAQEVFRCAHPPSSMRSALAGKKVTVKFRGHLLPSVAYYNPRDDKAATTRIRRFRTSADVMSAQSSGVPHEICACTMISNGAKFLSEWVYYHTHLGVSKFFLYDNNSEDDLDSTIASLTTRNFNVTKQPWPWVKTQEAGFSHCALLARPECEWMLFIDIDEFFFPNRKFLTTGDDSPLARFITDASTHQPNPNPSPNPNPVGQIMTFCHNFGPSGLLVSPPQGVTQGYTCRMRNPERHKSIVNLKAVATNLATVIHHFSLREGYQTVKVTPGVAVINHYKFQVWDEFRTKFKRRAATYVADWTEDRNHESKDRVPDLGTKAVKPEDWEKRFCEVWDYGLRNYTRSVFGTYEDGALRRLRMAWEGVL